MMKVAGKQRTCSLPEDGGELSGLAAFPRSSTLDSKRVIGLQHFVGDVDFDPLWHGVLSMKQAASSSSRPKQQEFFSLNDDSMLHVLPHMLPSQLVRMELVCRDWRRILNGPRGTGQWLRLLQSKFGSWANAPGRKMEQMVTASVKDWYKRLCSSQRDNAHRVVRVDSRLPGLKAENVMVVLETGIVSRNSRQDGDWMEKIQWVVNDYQPLSSDDGQNFMGQWAAFSFRVNDDVRVPECQAYYKNSDMPIIDFHHRVSICDVGSGSGRSPRHAHIIDSEAETYDICYDKDCGTYTDMSMYHQVIYHKGTALKNVIFPHCRCSVTVPTADKRVHWRKRGQGVLHRPSQRGHCRDCL